MSPMMLQHLRCPVSVAESADELAQSVVRHLVIRGHGSDKIQAFLLCQVSVVHE